MPTLVIATRNAHKVEEIQAVLGPRFRCLSLRGLHQAPPIAETGTTFAANATLKSEGIAAWLNRTRTEHPVLPASDTWVLADDSGLEVDALHGAPGVHSARFAAEDPTAVGDNTPDAANNAKLLRLLADVPAERRTGRFRCTLALTPLGIDSPVTRIFDGTCEGRLGTEPRGAHGFGYDPLFTPDGQAQTLGELGEATKNQLSHRARALAKLAAWWASQR